jgi:hypothetical protein
MGDQLLIENGKAVLTTEEGQRLERSEEQLLGMLRGEFVPPWGTSALPDGVKFYDWRPPTLVVVHQTPPHVRQVRWIAPDSPEPYGDEATYRKLRLSLPYVVTIAVYEENGTLCLTARNELYFRNEPLRSLGDRLSYPALLNVSRVEHPLRESAWICTQYLNSPDGADWAGQLQALLEHTFNGGFNLSSEHHEGASWYGLSESVHVDLHPVERWQQASAADDVFALRVPWKPVPLTVGEVVEALFLEGQAEQGPLPPLPSRFLNYAQRN